MQKSDKHVAAILNNLFFCDALKSQNPGGGRGGGRESRVYSEVLLRTGARAGGRGNGYRMHRCPAARVTGTGCNRTPITYVRTAAGEIGKEEEKGGRGGGGER